MRALLLRWAPAFSKALMCHLRKGEDLRQELQVRGSRALEGLPLLAGLCFIPAHACSASSSPDWLPNHDEATPPATGLIADHSTDSRLIPSTRRVCCCRTKLTASCGHSTGQTTCCRWAQMPAHGVVTWEARL